MPRRADRAMPCGRVWRPLAPVLVRATSLLDGDELHHPFIRRRRGRQVWDVALKGCDDRISRPAGHRRPMEGHVSQPCIERALCTRRIGCIYHLSGHGSLHRRRNDLPHGVAQVGFCPGAQDTGEGDIPGQRVDKGQPITPYPRHGQHGALCLMGSDRLGRRARRTRISLCVDA